MSSFVKAAILVLLGTISLFGVILGDEEQYLFACFLIGVFIIVEVIILLIIHYNKFRTFDLFSPSFLLPLAFICFLVIWVVSLYLNIGYVQIAQLTQKDVFYQVIGLFSFMFGILFAVLFCSIKKMGLAGEIVNKWHHKALFNRSAIIFIIGLIGVFIYYSQMGIPWLGDADKIRHGFEGRLYGIGFSIQLLQGLNLILASYLIYRLKKSSFFHIVCFLPFVVFILFVSLVSGYRWPVLIFLLSIFTMYHYIRKRLKINIRSFFIFSLIFLFTFSLLGFAGYLREATKERGEERFLKTVEVFNIPYNYRYIVPAVQAIQIRFVNYTRLTKMVPQEYGFFYGRYILSTVPVVKSVFPMLSPRQTSYYVSQTWFQQEVSPAFTGCGHFYIDFGLGGVLIGFFLLGFFAEKCYLRTIKNQDLLSIAFYCFILWLLFLWLISGINIGDLLPGIMALAIDKLIRLK